MSDNEKLFNELELIKSLIQSSKSAELSISGWLPKKTVMRFFDYGETQMRELEKEHDLVFSKIKSRKFYSVKSILDLIEKHKK